MSYDPTDDADVTNLWRFDRAHADIAVVVTGGDLIDPLQPELGFNPTVTTYEVHGFSALVGTDDIVTTDDDTLDPDLVLSREQRSIAPQFACGTIYGDDATVNVGAHADVTMDAAGNTAITYVTVIDRALDSTVTTTLCLLYLAGGDSMLDFSYDFSQGKYVLTYTCPGTYLESVWTSAARRAPATGEAIILIIDVNPGGLQVDCALVFDDGTSDAGVVTPTAVEAMSTIRLSSVNIRDWLGNRPMELSVYNGDLAGLGLPMRMVQYLSARYNRKWTFT